LSFPLQGVALFLNTVRVRRDIGTDFGVRGARSLDQHLAELVFALQYE
jgi:hypothetical protein